jgi:hypothetical protein
MFYRTLIVLVLVLLPVSTVAQTDKTVDCTKVPDDPNCSPRA